MGICKEAVPICTRRRWRRCAAAAGLVVLPSGVLAGGFWQLEPGGALAPGVTIERSDFGTSFSPDARPGAEQPALFVRLPRLASRLGLIVSQDGGRPSVEGLGFEAARNVRVSADGDIDMDEGDVSGEVNIHFDF